MKTLHNVSTLKNNLDILEHKLLIIQKMIWSDFEDVNTINEKRMKLFGGLLPKYVKGSTKEKYLPFYYEDIPWVNIKDNIINVEFEQLAIAKDVEHFIGKRDSLSLSSKDFGLGKYYFYLTYTIYTNNIPSYLKTIDNMRNRLPKSTSMVELDDNESKWLSKLESTVIEYFNR